MIYSYKNFKIFFLLAFSLFLNNSYHSQNQFKIIKGIELERYIYQNSVAGKQRYEGLFSKLIFDINDIELVQNQKDFMHSTLNDFVKIDSFVVVPSTHELILIFKKTEIKPSDFIKMFESKFPSYNKMFFDYREIILLKN